ncbi:MAG: aldehyde ferredoxin oxidoreductase family protein [Promethearchaeota archaeon]
MLHGYKGKLLYIELSQETYKTFSIPEEILKKYIGGRGLGAKLYWDLISPETDPLGQNNIFMVLTGPLGGTMVPGSGKHLIVCKSPTSGGWLESYSSGRVTPELKFAGYDGLIITGKANNPIYIIIEDENVEFSDASHLWGKGAFETETYIRENFHPDCGSLSIGPAGENLLPFACVGSDYFRKAGRGGAGAIMGSKNLKFIAIKGRGGISCVDMDKLYKLVLKHRKRYRYKFITPMGLSITNAAGMLPTRNFSRGQFERAIGNIDKDNVIDAKIADRACYACFSGCACITQVKDGIFKGLTLEGPEYETLAMLGSNLEIDYLPGIMKANYLCDDLGMDTISAGAIISFAMECYEKGILNKEETGGLELKFGNYEAMLELLELMAHKKDFGAFCAMGVKEMARSLGQNTEEFAMHSKGLEFPAYDPRAGWGTAITYSVTPRGACHRRAWPPSVEIMGGVDPFTVEGKAEIVRELMNQRCIIHSLLVCDMVVQIIRLNTNDWVQYLNIVTGLNYSGNDLNHRAEIIETLIRRINIREGFSSRDDSLPRRILEESHSNGPAAKKIIGKSNFLTMRNEYYLCRGWDSEGVPTQETLKKYEFDTEPNIEI